jgi:hypothetical protein
MFLPSLLESPGHLAVTKAQGATVADSLSARAASGGRTEMRPTLAGLPGVVSSDERTALVAKPVRSSSRLSRRRRATSIPNADVSESARSHAYAP